MENNYDVIVIGSGPAGNAVAFGLREKGKSVAVVEKDRWGGTCPNYGCDPTKIMMSAVETKGRAENMRQAGIRGELTVDWTSLLARKNAYTEPFPERMRGGLSAAGIDVLHGAAAFNADGSVQVAGSTYKAEKYVIAVGQRPRLLDIKGKEHLKTSNDFLALQQLPERLTFLGAGRVSLELAQIANAAGAEVTVITHGKLRIQGFDNELAGDFLTKLKEDGIRFIEEVSVQEIQPEGTGFILMNNAGLRHEAGLVISGVGRVPAVESLGLDRVGVTLTPAGIVVNDYLQSSNPQIYALGDAIDKQVGKLTPVSGFEARYLVENWEAAAPERIHYPVFPTVIYGSTKFAKVGQTGDEGLVEKSLDMTSWYTYRRVADPLAKAKITVDESGRVVGAAVLSTLADEVINLFTVFIEQGVSLEKFQRMIMAYPTPASDFFYLY